MVIRKRLRKFKRSPYEHLKLLKANAEPKPRALGNGMDKVDRQIREPLRSYKGYYYTRDLITCNRLMLAKGIVTRKAVESGLHNKPFKHLADM